MFFLCIIRRKVENDVFLTFTFALAPMPYVEYSVKLKKTYKICKVAFLRC